MGLWLVLTSGKCQLVIKKHVVLTAYKICNVEVKLKKQDRLKQCEVWKRISSMLVAACKTCDC